MNMALISPREIFLAALESRAVSVILIHNHPSGNPLPSSQDREITEAVAKTGSMLGLPLLDHIIIGDNTFYSFRNENAL